MKKLICTNPKNYKLTLNKEYLIVIDEEDTVMLINDNNKTVRYYKDLFQLVQEELVAPEPIVIIPRTEQDLIDSIEIDGLDVSYVNFRNEKVNIGNYLEIQSPESDFSCGVKMIVAVRAQICEIFENVQEDEQDMEQDLELLSITLIDTYFKNFIKYSIINGYNAGIYLMSCNVTGDNCLSDEAVDILDEISDSFTASELNPNSDNYIKIWSFYKSSI